MISECDLLKNCGIGSYKIVVAEMNLSGTVDAWIEHISISDDYIMSIGPSQIENIEISYVLFDCEYRVGTNDVSVAKMGIFPVANTTWMNQIGKSGYGSIERVRLISFG